MQSVEAVRKQMRSTRELQSVVKTMKSLAATSIWHYEQAVASLADYRRTVELGLQIVLRSPHARIAIGRPPQSERLGAIIFGSDQGLVGRFNDEILQFSLDRMNAMRIVHESRVLVAVGRRVEARLDRMNQPVAASFGMPRTLSGVDSVMQQLMPRLQAWYSEARVDRIVLFYNQSESGARYAPTSVELMPVDLAWLRGLRERPWQSNTLPDFDMPWEVLFGHLIREHLFVATQRAFAESLAAENASRLASMQAAERNIEDRLDELEYKYYQLRQSSITAELLDIVSGAEAVGKTWQGQ